MHPRNNFDGLRLAGALLVVISHQFALSGRPEPWFVGSHSFGNLGVLMFFSISGYLVASSWLADPHAGRFLCRRALRLWPGYAIVVVLCSGLAWATAADHAGRLRALHYLSNLWMQKFDAGFFPGLPIPLLNGSLWTVPLEAFCYVLLLTMALVLRSRLSHGIALLMFACLAVYVACIGQYGLSHFLTRGSLAFVAYFGQFFAAGALLRTAAVSLKPKHLGWAAGAGVLLIALEQPTAGLLLTVPAAVTVIGRASWPVLRSAGRFGDLSYGIYLYAWPVQQLVTMNLGPSTPYLQLLSVSLLIVLPCAVLSWHLIERPALRLKPAGPAAASALPRLSRSDVEREDAAVG